jgi:GNAT superfamily N-acetyltransferase
MTDNQANRGAPVTEGIVFRRAVVGDLQSIILLLADDELGRKREEVGAHPAAAYLDAFQAISADPNQLLIVADRSGQVVGTLQLSFMPGLSHRGMWRGQVESVRVSAAERSAGLGQKMLEFAISQCKSRGCGVVQLTTDKRRPDAHRFYERLGFVATHEGFKMPLARQE